jgi:hypothetical protein
VAEPAQIAEPTREAVLEYRNAALVEAIRKANRILCHALADRSNELPAAAKMVSKLNADLREAQGARDRQYEYNVEQIAKQAVLEAELKRLHTLRPASEWHEDYGTVLWHHLPIQEPPHVGTPLDSDWDDYDEGYYTHWSPIPMNPELEWPSLSGSAE